MTPVRRISLIVVGLVSLALGGIGIFVPLLPTTPLVLVAAFCFANSSERLHQWLLDHDVFGPLIDNWRRHRAISRNAKIMSVVSMAAILVVSWFMEFSMTVIAAQALILVCAAAFILTRPSLPRDRVAAAEDIQHK